MDRAAQRAKRKSIRRGFQIAVLVANRVDDGDFIAPNSRFQQAINQSGGVYLRGGETNDCSSCFHERTPIFVLNINTDRRFLCSWTHAREGGLFSIFSLAEICDDSACYQDCAENCIAQTAMAS